MWNIHPYFNAMDWVIYCDAKKKFKLKNGYRKQYKTYLSLWVFILLLFICCDV